MIAHILALDLGRLGELFPDTRDVSLNPASYAVCVRLSPFLGRINPDREASMCAIKNGDEIRCDFPSQLCPLVIYFLEKSSRFGSIRALLVLLLRRFTSRWVLWTLHSAFHTTPAEGPFLVFAN